LGCKSGTWIDRIGGLPTSDLQNHEVTRKAECNKDTPKMQHDGPKVGNAQMIESPVVLCHTMRGGLIFGRNTPLRILAIISVVSMSFFGTSSFADTKSDSKEVLTVSTKPKPKPILTPSPLPWQVGVFY
jgi:hypothetical protein